MSAEIEEESTLMHMKVLHRANQLPMVHSATTIMAAFYQQSKDYSPLVNSSLEMAENGAKFAGRMANPVVTLLDGNIHKVDDLACKVLAALQIRYPCLNMETEQISAALVKAGADVRGGAEKYAGALLESKPGQLALLGLAGYLRFVNRVADITLPIDDSVPAITFESSNAALLEVALLSDKLYRRVYRQSSVHLHQLYEVSTKALAELQSQLAILEFAKVNWEKYGMKDQTAKLWEQVQSTGHNVQQVTLLAAGKVSQQLMSMYDAASTSDVAERTLHLAQQISAQLVCVYEAAATSATNLPDAVQRSLMVSKAHVDKLYLQLSQVKSTKDLTTLVLSQIRESINLFQSSIAYIFQAASNVSLKQKPTTSSHKSGKSTMKPEQEAGIAEI